MSRGEGAQEWETQVEGASDKGDVELSRPLSFRPANSEEESKPR